MGTTFTCVATGDWDDDATWGLTDSDYPGKSGATDDVVIIDVANKSGGPGDLTVTLVADVELKAIKMAGTASGDATLHTASEHTLTLNDTEFSGYSAHVTGQTDFTGNVNFKFTKSGITHIIIDPASQTNKLNDITYNHASLALHMLSNITIKGDLIGTAGTLSTQASGGGTSYALTVTGDCYVAGTLTGNASAISLGSLEVAASGTYNATTGTTTITDEDSVTGYTWDVNGTFNNNDGGVTFDLGSGVDSHIRTGQSDGANSFHNLTVLLNASTNTLTMRPNAGTVMTIEGNLTISEGVLQKNTHSHTLTVTGNVEIHAGGKIDATSASGAMNMGSLSIDAGGTYLATSGTTTITGVYSSPFALTNSGTFTNNDGTLLLNRAGNQEFLGTWTGSSALHNLTIDGSGGTKKIRANMLIEGDLNVTANDTFTTHGNTETLTVNGDVEVSGTLGATSQTGAYSFNSLTTQNGGTFVASSGTTTILVDIRNRTGATFTHNGGTVLVTTGATYFIHNTGSYSTITFNNLTYSGVNCYLVKDIIVEGTFSNPSGYIRLTSNAKITLGTTTSQGTLAMGSNKLFPYATWYLYGASELYPGIVTGTNATPIKFSYGEGGANSANLKWLDIQFDINDVGGDDNYTITLDGSCEFDAVTIDADCTLDLNGQRAVFGGAFDLTTGALAMNDSMAVFTNTIDFNGRVPTSNTGTTIIHNPPSTSEKLITSLYFGGTFFAQGAESDVNGYAWGGSSGEYPAKVFVGGQLDCQQSVKTTTTMQVATGGELRGNDRTITCEGDFTMSGGLIGKSALSFPDGGNSPSGAGNYLDVPYDLVNLTGDATIEFWMKAAANTNDASRGIINGYKGGTANRWQLYQTTSNNMTFYSHDYNKGITVTCPTGKWTHVAIVCTGAGGDVKLYIDGKLEGQTDLGGSASLATSGAFPDFGVNRQLDSTDLRTGTRLFEGNLAMLRIWTDERTPSELRANMFATYANLASNTGCAIAYDFDEGTGTDVDDEVGSNNGTLVNVTWAGAGTFTHGTSTLDMTDDGTIGIAGGVTQFNNLKVAASGKTTTLAVLGGSSDIRFYGTLTHGGGTASSSGNPAWTMKGTSTVSAGSNWTGWYLCYWESSTAVPTASWKYWLALTDSTLAGDMTCTGYFRPHQSVVDIGNHTLTTHEAIFHSTGGVNMGAGTITFANAAGLSSSQSDSVFTGGPGATVTGVAAKSTFMSQNNFAIVGKAENLDVTNEELKVTGQVINCTGDIHQYFPTIDHSQQLDADTADDRDVRLGRDLDKNTELINS